MKVLTAVRLADDDRSLDYCDCSPGELVMPSPRCRNGWASAREEDEDDADWEDEGCECDCGEDFMGLDSLEMTTTATVAERSLTEADLRRAVRRALERSLWLFPETPRGQADSLIRSCVNPIIAATLEFDPGTVINHRDGLLTRSRPRRLSGGTPP